MNNDQLFENHAASIPPIFLITAMHFNPSQQGLALANALFAEGCHTFTFSDIAERLGKSKTATANLLKRMESSGLIVRVRRGHYVVRQLGMLGLPAVYEDIPLAVGAALRDIPHRIAYRTALYELGLAVHPPGAVQVAAPCKVRTKTFSGLALQVVTENPQRLHIGRVPRGASYISDCHRAILEAAQRPLLAGGIEVLAASLAASESRLRAQTLGAYASQLGWAAGLRRLGSLADALELESLQGRLAPLRPITADLDLEPGMDDSTVWRDRRWRIRWTRSVDEIRAVTDH